MTTHQSSSSFVNAVSQIPVKIAETATPRGKAMQAPCAEVDLLRRAGLPKRVTPAENGGPGGRRVDALKLTRTIVSGDSSNGQLTGYHHVGGVSQDLRFCIRHNQHCDA